MPVDLGMHVMPVMGGDAGRQSGGRRQPKAAPLLKSLKKAVAAGDLAAARIAYAQLMLSAPMLAEGPWQPLGEALVQGQMARAQSLLGTLPHIASPRPVTHAASVSNVQRPSARENFGVLIDLSA